MTDHFTNNGRPLHELLSRLLGAEPPLARKQPPFPGMGTLQPLNQQLAKHPVADFVNATLRGIGQVIFVNNPLSGGLILLALLVQSPWVGAMGLLGVGAATAAARLLKLDAETVRNGIFGYNGLLVGAALATFSDPTVGAGWWGWSVAVIVCAILTTVLMKTFGVWWATTVKTPPLTLPFNIITLICLALVPILPGLAIVSSGNVTATSLNWLTLGAAVPIGFGQVFLADKLISGVLILLAVAICSPLGALVGLLGGTLGTVSGLLLGISGETLYAGLWGYNAVLCAMAIGGIFYAPTGRSVGVGAIAACLVGPVGGLLERVLVPVGLPVLTVPFCVVTIVCMMLLTTALPSLVPVALHAVTSPEEHWQRYRAAKTVMKNFRHQLASSLSQQPSTGLFSEATAAVQGDLRYFFNSIDVNQSGTLSVEELTAHLSQTGQFSSETELTYLFNCIDRDDSGEIDFEEFGELILRHRRLMANYEEFTTYFLPIDADGDDAISLKEMNLAMRSVGEARLSEPESAQLKARMQSLPLTWNRFIEMLLVT